MQQEIKIIASVKRIDLDFSENISSLDLVTISFNSLNCEIVLSENQSMIDYIILNLTVSADATLDKSQLLEMTKGINIYCNYRKKFIPFDVMEILEEREIYGTEL